MDCFSGIGQRGERVDVKTTSDGMGYLVTLCFLPRVAAFTMDF